MTTHFLRLEMTDGHSGRFDVNPVLLKNLLDAQAETHDELFTFMGLDPEELLNRGHHKIDHALDMLLDIGGLVFPELAAVMLSRISGDDDRLYRFVEAEEDVVLFEVDVEKMEVFVQ